MKVDAIPAGLGRREGCRSCASAAVVETQMPRNSMQVVRARAVFFRFIAASPLLGG
jgi:hypothetical protein